MEAAPAGEDEGAARIAQRLAPLAAKDAQEVRAKWSWAGEATEVLCTRFNIEMERKHFRRLNSGAWLNDDVINFYMGMLQERSDAEAAAAAGGATQRRVWFANTFFLTKLRENDYRYDNALSWTRGQKVLDMDLIIIQCHMSLTHWTCIVVDVPARTVTHYDSKGRAGGTAHADLACVLRWLCQEAREKCGTTMEAEEWDTRDLGEGAPQQHKDNDW